MSKEFIENPLIKRYVDDDKCTIILFENPPYFDSGAITYNDGDITKRAQSATTQSFVKSEFLKNIGKYKNNPEPCLLKAGEAPFSYERRNYEHCIL